MDTKYIRNSFRLLYGMLLLVVIYSCANIGSPNGGPYDEDPPRFVSSTPVPNQINYKGKKIEILFDELIQIDKPSENVIITPPQMELPIIRSAGKKAVIELKDTLKENTTYAIDFTNSIADNNEKNVFENFLFAFSTGDVIDTLEVSGVLLNAENLEPMPGITIGLHSNLEDSAFVKLPFDRTSRTNDKGQFTIRNIAPGAYHIFALNDVNRDYKFDQPGEDIAFLDSVIVPTFELTSRQDTAWKDSLTIDTIRTVGYTRFMPDNIELRLFKEKFERQYMVKPKRPDEKYFTLRFNSKLDTVPVPVPVNFTPEDSAWYFVQQTEGGLAVNYWLADSTVWKQDTLQVQVSYPKSDSLNILRPQTDTVQLVMRRRPAEKKKKKKDEPEPIDFLGMQVSASGSMNLYDTISVTFTEPVLGIDKDMSFLDQKVDTVWNAVDYEFFPDTTNSLNFFIKRPWKYGEEYRIEVDSAAITSLYGKWNNFFTSEFKIKKEDEYGHLYLNIVGVDTTAFVELLSTGDAPVRKAKVKDGGVLFMDLRPDKYYARIVLDTNDNGVWDTGNYAEKRQPETVYYSPKMYEVMQNWQVEETWNVTSTPLAKQKPLEITKNKPKEVTKKKRNYKDESQ
ncbi:MAG: Ig-like domain-containing protein [Parabacteroides sp.]|nr:Ig-like domain-containing protein [Parabacteroides sp.]